MGRWKIGSFTAALGCIALGVIIVMAQYDMISYEVLGFLWPALLVLFGLEMLIRLFIKSDVKSRVSGWAILLIIVLIGASGAQTVMAGGSLSNLIGNTHLTPLSGNVEVKENITTLKIVLPSGKVKVEGVAGSSLDYEGSLLLPGKSQSDAESALEKKWKVSTEGDTLIMELDTDHNWFSNIQFGFNTKSPYLNISAPNNLAVEVETSDGSIEAWNLKSGIEVETSNGALNIHDIVGEVDAHTSNGSLSVQNIQGEVELVSSNGAIVLDNIDGALSAKSSNGKITINSAVTGNWKCTSSNGKIIVGLPAVSDAKIIADTSNGSLKGNVPWDRDGDSYGTAVLGKATYTVDLSTSNGSVTVDTAE
ncbi:DUF5668 domain-containing protein [Paenibacillus sp. FSL R7-0048]|jgi:DUF4097 and DUF4098 domain-containing protein YvlB|uniref:DUF4097 family beta strand repeat-containing protein n=1 Tax=Paenibacillus TaxID=44249 RepID=UPI00096DE592|nr:MULTISPECIES: DUF5668 domain-containing protein [Paenibacillus]MDH6425723.1 DUF4097 and DUF4098 domain-containing protein YvlB [Paenibacillus sp. PastH-4]MDH6441743.1 DUF4097 and DUF4098 domain-containing protein YvlB [Paenibacillus sp. PastF-4]MDH6529746.1 DUF4097 and DUF4098 domain-containing protein YvlB [Paenibacillus sp. PastH-3]OMC79737.1 hypothetical protein BK125_05500 [Paenibacillus odorifer]OMD65866.1 hypothetical protein BSK62_12415 [Paenibacillus odorifer]